MGEYRNVKGKDKIDNAEDKEDGFKKGGKIKKKVGGSISGKKEMKACGGKMPCRADRPARKSGGAVFSSASGPGTPRGKAAHY